MNFGEWIWCVLSWGMLFKPLLTCPHVNGNQNKYVKKSKFTICKWCWFWKFFVWCLPPHDFMLTKTKKKKKRKIIENAKWFRGVVICKVLQMDERRMDGLHCHVALLCSFWYFLKMWSKVPFHKSWHWSAWLFREKGFYKWTNDRRADSIAMLLCYAAFEIFCFIDNHTHTTTYLYTV